MKKQIAVVLFLLYSALYSQDSVYGGLEVSWINAEGSGGVDGISRLMPQFNAGLEFELNATFTLVTELAFYLDNFAYENGAVPVESEYYGSCATGCLRFDFASRWSFPLGGGFTAYVQGGAGTVLHFPLPGADVFDLYGYFYFPPRLFDLNGSAGLRLIAMKDVSIDLRIRTFVPVYRLFDGGGVSILDQFQIAPGVFFVLPLSGPAPKTEAPDDGVVAQPAI
jgi:hypothetical protein